MSENALEVLFPASVSLEIAGEKFDITPMKFRQRTQVITLIAQSLAAIRHGKQGQDLTLDYDDLLTLLPRILGDDMGRFYAIVLGRSVEWVNDSLDMRSEAKLLQAFVEVNDLPFFVSMLRSVGQKIKAQSAAVGMKSSPESAPS